MLEKSGSTFYASCDFCPDSVDTQETEFLSAVEAIKRLAWKVFKKMGEWFHKCGCCQAEDGGKDFDNV